MRPSRRLGVAASAAAILVALAAQVPATAQVAPFTVGGGARSQGADIPANRSPSAQRDIAAEEAAPLAPVPDPGAAPSPASRLRGRPTGPRPFDINGDGASPNTALPMDEEPYFPSASTTVSPLAGGRQPSEVVPIDAVSPEQRDELNLILKREVGEVRELRVNIDNSQEWVDSVVDRPIVPYQTLRLDGEIDERSWNVFLSATEAARGGTLSIAFTNSVLVLPEASRLRVILNGRQIAQTAIDSPDRTKVIALPIPADLLRAGENAISLEADMRHRIDCSLNATYELWTRIDTRLTGFSFGGDPIALMGLADLPAIGVGINGGTRIRVIQPQSESIGSIDRMLRAVQSAAVRGGFLQPLVEVADTAADVAPVPGTVNVAIGTVESLKRIAPQIPLADAAGSTLDLIDTPIGPTVIITGPTERDVDDALARFDAQSSTAGAQPTSLAATPAWLVQNGARIRSGSSITLADAGVETIEFSGRRFHRSFNVNLPPDFYAAAYGEAEMLLDAAYTSDVRPGSRLLVFVNGTLSTAISFTSKNGERLDDFPITLGMQAFRPGRNTIELAAELDTEADRACLPGGTVPSRDRFALLSTTRLVFPAFARIGQLPNLASFATNGFPYGRAPEPIRVRVAGTSPDTVGAAGTMLARLSISRGAPLRTTVVDQVDQYRGSGVIVIAPLSEVDNQTLEATGAAGVIPASWLQPGASPGRARPEPEGLERYDEVLRRLRQQVRQEEVQGTPTVTVDDRLAGSDLPLDQRNEIQRSRDRWFDEAEEKGGVGSFIGEIFQSIRGALKFNVRSGATNDFTTPLVSDTATLVLAQAVAPDRADTAWTLVTAPSAALLSTSMAAIAAPDVWARIGGRITTFELDSNTVETVPVERVEYLATAPLSFSNLRLIAANWFSLNSGIYALGLIVAALFLGLLTWAVVRPLGRTN